MKNPLNLLNRSLWNAKPRFRIDAEDQAALEQPGTLLLAMERDRLLRYLPSGGKIAEIGVARGAFSAQLSDVCKPSYLALVDPWHEQDTKIYYSDSNNAAQTEQDRRYQNVAQRFASDQPGRECKVLRKYSAEATKEFRDQFFDWVFIDGNHSYDACLEDLRLWAPKVQADGLICGHDFAVHSSARQARYGVVEAVQTFVSETGFGLAALTVEHFPTFVIAKDMSGATLRRMRQLIFSSEAHVIQLQGWDGQGLDHARLLDTGRPRSAFMSFHAGGSRKSAQ